VVKADIQLNPSTFPKNEIGIDLGTTNFLITSDGRTVSNPKFLRCLKVKPVRRQRELSRKKRGSSNKYRARVKVARIHSKITNSREDFLHKLSSRLIGENQAIYVEEIDTKALLERKTKLYKHRYSKSIADSGWSSFLDMLEYKAKLYGRVFSRVCARYTSQFCNNCKYHIGKLSQYQELSMFKLQYPPQQRRKYSEERFNRGAHGDSLWRVCKTWFTRQAR
jgi:putative transposase